MEKIRSGQSFLYREHGYNGTTLEVCMTDRVRGDCLQAAIGKTVQRMPDMACKLVEKNASYYLQQNDVSMNATATDSLRTLGSMQTGYHLLDVTFTGRLLRVSFHHALCDGVGARAFTETLIYYYCSLRYLRPGRSFDSSGIHTLERPLDIGETAEPLGTRPFPVSEREIPPVVKDGFALPESTTEPAVCRRTAVEVDEGRFVSLARQVGATPGLLAAILFSRAVADLHPDVDKPVVCSMAADLRSAIGMELTRRNCTGSFSFPYARAEAGDDLSLVAMRYRELLAIQRADNAVKKLLNMQIGLFNKLDGIPTLEDRKSMMSMFDHLLINTYVLSYLGRLRLNDFARHVHSAHLYSSGIKGLTLNMVASGQVISFDVLQGFDTDAYANAFIAQLDERAIPYTTTGIFSFKTGEDRSHITASRQAERYFAPARG